MAGALRWDIACAVGTNVDADGFLSIQHDAYGEGDAGVPAYQAHHPHGIWSCPIDPVIDPATGQSDPARACQVLIADEGGVGHAIALEDPRTVANLPLGQPGETIVHNDFGCFTRYYADGSICHSTTTAGGLPSSSSAPGASQAQSVSEWITPSSLERHAPWAHEVIDATGFWWKHTGGARLTLGYAGGMPPPFGSAYVRARADMIALVAPIIAIGSQTSKMMPVAQVLPLMAWITSQLVPLLDAIVADLGPATSAGKVSAALIGSFNGSIGALPAAISTQTAIG